MSEARTVFAESNEPDVMLDPNLVCILRDVRILKLDHGAMRKHLVTLRSCFIRRPYVTAMR